MIAVLEGVLDQKAPSEVILMVNGIGYEINISAATYEKLPGAGNKVKFYISESQGMFGSGTSLYGFLDTQERDIFLTFKDGLKNTGARKALDYLDKATKSLPDFQRAVKDKNTKLLISIFGFRGQTAEKIVALLHDKLSDMSFKGKEKWPKSLDEFPNEAVLALVALGYKEAQAKNAVEEAISGMEKIPPVGELVKIALKHIQ